MTYQSNRTSMRLCTRARMQTLTHRLSTAFWLQIFGRSGIQGLQSQVPMPRSKSAAAAASKPCNIDGVWKEWKQQAAVRHVAVEHDRMFASSQGDQKKSVKICIKDAVHNQHVLAPVLRRMAVAEKHKLPYVKILANESLA